MEVRRIDYEDGGWCEQQYVDGRLHGFWTVYYPDGRKKWKRQHINGRKEGYYREWDTEGRLREEQFYHLNELHGPWRRWDERGCEKLIGEFSFGREKRHGRVTSGLWARLFPYWEWEPEQFRGHTAEIEQALARPTCRFCPDETRPFADVFGASYFGYVNVLGVDEEWPEIEGVPFSPILQLDCTQLPFRSDELADVRLVTIFARPDEVSSDFGTDFVLRSYTSADQLVPPLGMCGQSPGRPRFITFLPPEQSYPDPNDLPPGLKVHLEDEEPESPLWTGADWSLRSRVGGWPGWVQFSRVEGMGNFAFQLDSIDVDGWSCGDCTVHYFFRDVNGWAWHQEMC
jgi:hypothetical protein